jgi:protoporphyrinogen oxidase
VAASGNTDVAVVGGGLAGLAVALYLSRAGLRVTLHEKSRHLGGRARTRTIERFRFNVGPHALYCAGRGAAVLHDLGVRVEGNRPGHGAYAVRSGRFHTLPIGFVSLASTGLLRPLEKLEVARRLNELRTIDTSVLQNVPLIAWLQHTVHDVVRELLEAIVRVSTYTWNKCSEPFGAACGTSMMAGRRSSISCARRMDGRASIFSPAARSLR